MTEFKKEKKHPSNIDIEKKIIFECNKCNLPNLLLYQTSSRILMDIQLRNSTTRPVGFYWTSSRNCQKFLLHFLIKLAILRHLKLTYKILVDAQQNSTGCLVDSRAGCLLYSSTNRNSTGRLLDQMIWVSLNSVHCTMNIYKVNFQSVSTMKLNLRLI